MLGLDFGTTNSAIGAATREGAARLATFREGDGETSVFRSALHFSAEGHGPNRRPQATAGPRAIASYLDEGAGGRFLQSLKSYLASRLFNDTLIYGWRFTLEDLIATLLRELRDAARAQLGDDAKAVVIGRPVHFVIGEEAQTDPERDAAALVRLRGAAEAAGFEEIAFEYEPVAAAFEYERSLDHDELVLIGDFGGGTSDFCLVRLGPSERTEAMDRSRSILAVDGVPVAGGAFDGRIVRHVVAPRLGRGSLRRSEHGKELPVPAWIYARLERWEDVSFLKTRETLETLRQLEFEARERSKIASLIRLVEDDLGYLLYRAVERTKVDLSGAPRARFAFHELPRRIDLEVARSDFEGWIEDLVAKLEACVDALLARAGAAPSAIDRVFLTGGTSLVPRVREIFETRFGADRLRGGEELTTVARGLALIAAHRAAA
ncbi:MAG TPA: Hsp70 family protein [Candidatus Binatia bacterium]|nr:Hsp70 family protein [Candidatus Binatia bacterium]